MRVGAHVGDTTPAGAHPAGSSPYGLLGVVGNVREWAESDGGGGFRDDVHGATCGTRSEIRLGRGLDFDMLSGSDRFVWHDSAAGANRTRSGRGAA
jgi:hypothetical protein